MFQDGVSDYQRIQQNERRTKREDRDPIHIKESCRSCREGDQGPPQDVRKLLPFMSLCNHPAFGEKNYRECNASNELTDIDCIQWSSNGKRIEWTYRLATPD